MVDTAKTSSATASSTTASSRTATGAASSSKAGATTGTAAGSAHSSTNIETLAKTTEFRWFVAHAVVVVSTVLTVVPLFKASRFFYRLGHLAALTSFVIILIQKYHKHRPALDVLAQDDEFQYAVISLFWLLTPAHKLALLPLGIFSLFHTLTYTRSYLLPALNRADSPLSRNIDTIIKRYNEPFTVVAANFEIALLLQLIGQAVLFVRGSWVQLAVYVAFLRVRFATSAFTRHAAKVWEVRADQIFGMHPLAKQYWAQVKAYLAKIPGPAQKQAAK